MAPGPIPLHIADVLTAVPAQVGVEAGMVMLTEDEAPFRSLRIIIGQPEANAIHAGWHGAVPGRPSTWDLYVATVALLGARIDRVVITSVHEERHYFAHIELEHEGQRRILACRPSDAIAVAVRAYNAAILAEPSVLDAAGVLPDGTKPQPRPGFDPALAEREAALAAREAELAERERLIAAREQGTSPPTAEPPSVDPPVEPRQLQVREPPTDLPPPPVDLGAEAFEPPASTEVVGSTSAGVDPTSAPAGPDLAPAPPVTEPSAADLVDPDAPAS